MSSLFGSPLPNRGDSHLDDSLTSRREPYTLALLPCTTAQRLDVHCLFENINDAIFVHDLAGKLLEVNQVACQRLGYSREELLRLQVVEIDAPENATHYAETIREIERTGSLVFESRHRRKDGDSIPVEVNARRIEYQRAPAILSVARDIHTRKHAEAELRRQTERLALAEEKYRNIFENAVEGIFQSTLDGRYLSVNSAMAHIFGYASPEDMMAHVGNDIEHKVYADPKRRAEFMRLLEAQGVVRDFIATNYRKDGTLIWTNTNARVVRDADGTLLYYEGFLEDITERQRTEAALKKSEERFSAQYKSIPVPTYTWKKLDPDFVLIDYNDAAFTITHDQVPNLLGQNASALYHDEPAIRQDLVRCLDEQTTFQREMRIRMRSTNDWADLIVSYAYIPPDLVMVHTEDITQRKQAEAALRQSEARYRTLMEQAADGITLIDARGKYLDVNSTACTMLGYTRDEMLQKSVADVLAPGSLERVPIPFAAMREGKTVVMERVMRRKDGTLFPTEVRTKMLPDGTFHGIFHNIGERKRMEAEIQAMLQAQREWNADLEDKVRAKTAELRQLSEMRDHLLRQIIVAQEEEHRRVARELHDETSQALTALIANVAVVQTLPPSKVKAQLNEIKTAIVEILKGVNQIVLDLRPTLLDDYGLMPALSWYANKRLGSGIRVELNAPELEMRLPPIVEMTLFRIGQEAITNVARHARANCVQMDLRLSENGKTIMLQVMDDGIGFYPDPVKKQNPDGRPRLGLLGMQERVQLIGGRLRIESAPGKGTLVSAAVPLSVSMDGESAP